MVLRGVNFHHPLGFIYVYLAPRKEGAGTIFIYTQNLKMKFCIEIDPDVKLQGSKPGSEGLFLDPSLTCKRQHQLLTYTHRLSCFNLPNLQRENVGSLAKVLSGTCNTMYQTFILQGHPHF